MRTKLVVALILATGMLAVVQAQQGRQGFGMGMGGFGISPSMLVINATVQEDLKMKEDQVDKVKSWAKDFAPKAAEIRKDKGVEFGGGGGGGGKGKGKGGFGGGQQTPEMQEKIAAANVEINKLAFKELGDILSKDQITRLKEIYIQARGINAFTEPEVADALKLSDSQKTQLKTLTTDMGKEQREMFQGGGGGFGKNADPEKQKEMATKMQKLQADYKGKAVDVLTDEQKKTWKTLIGAPFDTTKLTQPRPRQKD